MRIPQRTTMRWMLCLALSLALAGCATSQTSPKPTATAMARPPTTTTPKATGDTFICANPPGSQRLYAYVLGSYLHGAQKTYLVHGCDAPLEISHADDRNYTPLAFSTDASWLLISDDPVDQNNTNLTGCLKLVSTSSRQVIPTSFCNPNPVGGPTWEQWYAPIAWAGPNSFYLSTVSAKNNSVQVSRVSVPSLARTQITTLTWVAEMANQTTLSGIALRQNALFYGGYMSSSEGGAYLHRYDLATGADTRFVRLGLAGTGGCQVADVPCSWTGPWDISPDATKLTYHNPGPTHDITDTYVEPGQPLYLSAPDGSGAQKLFPAEPTEPGFNAGWFSPDGRYIAAGYNGVMVFERLTDGALTTAPSALQWGGWTPQSGVVVMYDTSAGDATLIHLDLYNYLTGARTPLQTGTHNYVWA